jgi:Xaa-Pro aminopeptidase
MNELDRKLASVRGLLAQHGLDALLLQRVSSFAWATCGAASYINTAATNGTADLLITPSGRYLITNNIEATRLEQEEKLAEQGWEFQAGPWHAPQEAVPRLIKGLKLGADGPYPGATDLSGEMARLRANLLPEEVERFRTLCRLCAGAMDAAIQAVRPGMTECEISGLLAHESDRRGAQAIVNLIATDDRVFKFRHPLPTGKELERYAMLVLCGRQKGLVCSVTRLVHFGTLPDELRRKTEAVAHVDATFIAATRPGRTLGVIFQKGVEAYARAGFAGEWQHHHQGGPAAYEPREYLAVPGSSDSVALGQVYAWNPSIAGTKSEDTILVGEDSNEVLTSIEGWPMVTVTVDGQTFSRPAILEIT